VRACSGRRGAWFRGAVAAGLVMAGATGLVAAPGAAQAQAAAGPGVSVSGAIGGYYSGGLLWSQNRSTRRPMGSITKVMTALVVLRAGSLGREVTVTQAAVAYVRQQGESSAGLVAGDVLTVGQLLEAMLLPSGGDAAYLLAATYGPGTGAFIARMNATAAALGLSSTHFTSFDGMPVPTEYSTYSTPADLIRLGRAAMRYPAFRQIVAQRSYALPATAGHHGYVWKQTNGLIGTYPGAMGIKTGYTHAAGACLLFEAHRGSRTLIGVVLDTTPKDNLGVPVAAAARLLNWGFAQPA
jgi:serine-type D-Ala-D-Ala carboxypeptidase (penicillin-binding protein 5/6)